MTTRVNLDNRLAEGWGEHLTWVQPIGLNLDSVGDTHLDKENMVVVANQFLCLNQLDFADTETWLFSGWVAASSEKLR